MVQHLSIMNFRPVVRPFGSTLKKVVLGYVMLGVAVVEPCSIINFGPVFKRFGSTLKKVSLC